MRIRTRRAAVATAALVIAATACESQPDSEPESAAPADTPQTEVQPSPSTPAGGAAPSADLPEGVTAEMVQQGQQIFTGQGICYTCHGPDATGTALAPNLTDDEWINIDGSYDQIVQTVTTGVPEPVQHPAPMPPMGGAQLTEDQIRAVAAYVYSLSHG